MTYSKIFACFIPLTSPIIVTQNSHLSSIKFHINVRESQRPVSFHNEHVPEQHIIVAVVLHTLWWEDPIFVNVLPLLERNKFQATIVSINKKFPYNGVINMLNILIAVLNNLIETEWSKHHIMALNHVVATTRAPHVSTFE